MYPKYKVALANCTSGEAVGKYVGEAVVVGGLGDIEG